MELIYIFFPDLSEVIDVCEMLGEIPSPASAILEVLSQIP